MFCTAKSYLSSRFVYGLAMRRADHYDQANSISKHQWIKQKTSLWHKRKKDSSGHTAQALELQVE